MNLRALVIFVLLVAGAGAAETPPVQKGVFGRTPDGSEIELFTLTNRNGAVARIITFGAIVADLRMPDRDGRLASVVREVLPDERGFQRGFPNSAALQGRVANRIAFGRFTLDGKEYQLAKNAGGHHIHGGVKGFSRMIWTAAPVEAGVAAVALSYVSADREEGYPGRLSVTVVYTLTDQNVLRMEYSATTDAPTILNLTNHAYFNLSDGGDVADYLVNINADRTTAFDAQKIPTGEITAVKGTGLDFATPVTLGERAAQLTGEKRFDHNFILNRPAGSASLVLAARASDPRSGRTMEAWTTEPAVQMYTNVIGAPPQSDGRGWICLETQHYPDSINHPGFPSTVLRPGQTFRSTTEYRFTAK